MSVTAIYEGMDGETWSMQGDRADWTDHYLEVYELENGARTKRIQIPIGNVIYVTVYEEDE